MKDLLKTIFENMNKELKLEKPLNTKFKLIELLYLVALIDITDSNNYFEDTRKKIYNYLRPSMTMILRSFPELSKYYTYDNIFDKRSGEEAQKFLDIILDESYNLNKK